jgi:hypothetical protein
MVQSSLVQIYKSLKAQPTPAKKLILEVASLTGRKESAIRKWLDGSVRPDASTCTTIEHEMGMPFDNLIKEYYHRLQEPTQAQVFRQQLAEVTQKSPITILRYVTGITIPDALTRSVIAKELNTPISILFP